MREIMLRFEHIRFKYFLDISIYRGYAMLFDECEIDFTSETGLLIFSRVK
jgi:hypothetical protein